MEYLPSFFICACNFSYLISLNFNVALICSYDWIENQHKLKPQYAFKNGCRKLHLYIPHSFYLGKSQTQWFILNK